MLLSFQSAPLTEARGDVLWRHCQTLGVSFQSAPLTEARGDSFAVLFCCFRLMFQSAPLTEARGDVKIPVIDSEILAVSIRSPYRSKGRLEIGKRRARNGKFQSAPLTEARGDVGCVAVHAPNPGVSIRSPYRSKGRCVVREALVTKARVSIRSPYRSKGRDSAACRTCPQPDLQSAPLTEARGEMLVAVTSKVSEG